MSQTGAQPCPILTHAAVSLQEAVQGEVPEIRAYKLGKRRWSYNQVELFLCEAGEGGRMLSVKQAVNMGTDNFKEEVRVQLANEYRVQVHAFLCYDTPVPVEVPVGGNTDNYLSEETAMEEQYSWCLVDRHACQKGCSGPVLRAIQRFGKLGKRSWGVTPSPDLSDRTNNNMKDPRYFYLSFDEAGTHVGVKAFRLVVAIYDQGGRRRLSECVSPPIRVLANNDVPTGAAHIMLHAQIPSGWEGWQGVLATPEEPVPFMTPITMGQRALPSPRMDLSPYSSAPGSHRRPSSSADSADYSHHSSSGADKRLRSRQTIKSEDVYEEGMGAYSRHTSTATMYQSTERRARRRLSMAGDDPDYVPRRGTGPSEAPMRLLPARRHSQADYYAMYSDVTPEGTPTQSIPSPGATTSNTSLPLVRASPQQQGPPARGDFSPPHQQRLQQPQQGGGRLGLALGPQDLDQLMLGLQPQGNADATLPQVLQQSASGNGSGHHSVVHSPYHSASHQSLHQGSPVQDLQGSVAEQMMGGGGRSEPCHQQQHPFLPQTQQPFQNLYVGQQQLPRQPCSTPFQQPNLRILHDEDLPLSHGLGGGQQYTQTSCSLLLDPPGGGGCPSHLHGSHRQLNLPQLLGSGGSGAFGAGGSLEGSMSDDPIAAFLDILVKSQGPCPGSPVIELPSFSPGGSPSKSPLRRPFQLSPLGQGSHGGGVAGISASHPSNLSNTTGFLSNMMPPSSPHSTLQGSPGQQQQYQQYPGQQGLQYNGRPLAMHQQETDLHAFGSTMHLGNDSTASLKGGQFVQHQHQHCGVEALKAPPQQQLLQKRKEKEEEQQQQQQEQPPRNELFFRCSPGLASMSLDNSLTCVKLSPAKLHSPCMDPPPCRPRSPLRLGGSDLSPLRLAHSPNSISTPTPSALDDIFNTFQPTVETAAEALMHGESVFASEAIKQEQGVSSGVCADDLQLAPTQVFPQQVSSLEVR